jgi:tetratricopeptide (TPR) repeat protein
MKTFASESYTIAWFKIADFVARGEKERALHMYRLLMHSVPEPAISYQLEGDILLAFDDMNAVERYHKAVDLYKKSGKIKQAIAVYEHALFFLEDETILKGLLDLYVFSENIINFIQVFSKLSKIYLNNNYQQTLTNFVLEYQERLPLKFGCILYATYIRSVLLYGTNGQDISETIDHCIDLFLKSLQNDLSLEKEFQKFLSDLKFLDMSEYQKVEKKLQS